MCARVWERQEKIRSATIPRVTSSTYFQVNDNYYPGRTCAAVCRPQFPQIIALFIWRWVDPVSFSVFRRFRGARTRDRSKRAPQRERDEPRARAREIEIEREREGGGQER